MRFFSHRASHISRQFHATLASLWILARLPVLCAIVLFAGTTALAQEADTSRVAGADTSSVSRWDAGGVTSRVATAVSIDSGFVADSLFSEADRLQSYEDSLFTSLDSLRAMDSLRARGDTVYVFERTNSSIP